MALRVLLADESSTIKKVIQLALHDYGVEVKSVPNGLDVLLVVKSYEPDIVFADVLLTKKSGYEVCADLQKDPSTQKIPVVLMWSGFMEIDATRFEQCGARAKLEKPFDTNSLRALVNDLVPKTLSNPVSAFLKFPKLPEIVEENKEGLPLNAPPSPEPLVELGLNDPFVTGEEFEQIPLSKSAATSEEGWSSENLSKFKIEVAPEPSFENRFVIPDEDIENIEIENSGDFEEIHFSNKPPKAVAASSEVEHQTQTQTHTHTHVGPVRPPNISNLSIPSEEKLLLEARSIIESVCWKILPDIAEKLVREEIQKLLKETEKGF